MAVEIDTPSTSTLHVHIAYVVDGYILQVHIEGARGEYTEIYVELPKNPRKILVKKSGIFFARRKSSKLSRLTFFKTIEEWGRQFKKVSKHGEYSEFEGTVSRDGFGMAFDDMHG
jgi:hypothetical protein